MDISVVIATHNQQERLRLVLAGLRGQTAPATRFEVVVVEGGIWRVAPRDFMPGIRPIVELISPPIGRDSALFNRVRVRLRVLHTQPLESQITLLWRNPANEGLRGFFINAPPRTGIDHITLLKGQRHIYTADWQEVTIDSVASKTYVIEDKVYRRLWEGELLEIRLRLPLFNYSKDVEGPGEIPEAVEIDWIELTHAERPDSEVAPPRGEEPYPVGTLFALPIPFEPAWIGHRAARSARSRVGGSGWRWRPRLGRAGECRARGRQWHIHPV